MAISTLGAKTAGRTRVGGSGFTIFIWNSQPIAFARQVGYVSPTPVGAGPTPIQPIDSPYVLEIITPAAQTIGSITLELYELYNQKVWWQLKELTGAVDLVNIFIIIASLSQPVTMNKLISPPNIGQGGNAATNRGASYFETYHDCVITNVEDGETIEIGTMEITKRITVAYTRVSSTLPGGSSADNLAIQLSNGNASSASSAPGPAS